MFTVAEVLLVKQNIAISIAEFIDPDGAWGDEVNSGKGLSYRMGGCAGGRVRQPSFAGVDFISPVRDL
jgi:hypothetical protein